MTVWRFAERMKGGEAERMTAMKIEDIRHFTSELLVGETFDRFQLSEAVIVTFNTFRIDGRVRKGYYTEEEREEGRIGEFSAWPAVKPFCYSLMKGKKLPEQFRIVLRQPPEMTERFLVSHGIPLAAEQVGGLYLNIRYEEGKLLCVTGTSLNVFTADRALENAWDEAAAAYLRARKLPFTVL